MSRPLQATGTFAEALDGRDVPSFDQEWMRVHRIAERRFSSAFPGEKATRRASLVSKPAYLRALALHEDPDLAAYVSEGFSLIGTALLTELDDPWLNALFDAYVEGRLPTGRLSPREGRLHELMSPLLTRAAPK